MAYLIKYDSVHGTWPVQVRAEGGSIVFTEGARTLTVPYSKVAKPAEVRALFFCVRFPSWEAAARWGIARLRPPWRQGHPRPDRRRQAAGFNEPLPGARSAPPLS